MNFFNNLNIGKKIYLVSAVTALIFVTSLIWLYSDYREQIYKSVEKKLAASVETAWGVIDHYSRLAADGTLSTQEAQQQAKETVRNLRFEGDDYFWITDSGPKMIMHPTSPKLEGQDVSNTMDPDGVRLFVEMVKATQKTGAGSVRYQWNKPGQDQPQPKISFVKRHQQWDWIIGAGVYVDDVVAQVNKVFYSILSVITLCLLISILLIYLLARSISRPMALTVKTIEEIEKGRYHQRLSLNRNDEIGKLGSAMDGLADSFETVILPMLDKLANGDITFSPVPRDELDGPQVALKKVSDNLNDTMGTIQSSAQQINSASGQVADASQSLSQGATESAASLEEITSSLNELSSQTKLNAENATQVNQLSKEARLVAEEGNSKMQNMVAAMAEISDASQSINKIIKVIDEIAFQTNLLALNAAVEAARAGQHGKGFAVVAEEVRNLAARSAKAASETAELIAGSVGKTANGAEIANQTASALEKIYSSVVKVSELAEEIAASSNEQAQGIGQINEGLGQIDQVIQQNTATAEESAAAAEELSSQAEELLNMLSLFRLKNPTVSAASQKPVARPRRPVPQQGPRQNDNWNTLSRATPPTTIALDDSEFGRF
ncbi:methyl-accepting chemotaxis protein [Pelobacter seleniigenes]|uniref:methyl-accepting chemotaxis protein n=1 Tax=Pelobacter seleniigenes TaxID=407188 RepID=UPI00068AF01E|nr:methyl-accepting chemotaxis protein [Pelobacter seleniigenes]